MTSLGSTFPVLVLDDDSFILKTMKSLLQRLGLQEIYTTDSSATAVQLLKDQTVTIELILMDLNMPGFDGISFLRILTELRFAGGIVIVSGESEQTLSLAGSLGRARQLNIVGGLRKPVRMAELHDLIHGYQPRVSGPDNDILNASSTVSIEQLRAAIGRDELEPWFQPKVDIKTGAAVGVEMLARWNSAGSYISPGVFIPMAEDADLIDTLTFQLLGKAVKWVVAWQLKDIHLHLAINISMGSLRDINLADHLLSKISGTGINLIVEVTESQLLNDLTTTLDNLLRLRLNKVALSIDDFGTGASNISQLRALPFDELKIDLSFVQGASEDPRCRSILRHTVALAEQLGITTVAEGVEKQCDWDIVKEMNCDLAQGFFIAPPMHGSLMEEWINNWQTRCTDWPRQRNQV